MKTIILLFCCVVMGSSAGFSFPNLGVSSGRPVAFEPAVGFFVSAQPYGMTPRIVGGNEATPYSHPHQISLQVLSGGKWYHNCGGSIVEVDKIVTAAHCVVGYTANQLRVVAGEHDLFVDEGFEQVSPISKLIPHPQYNGNTIDYDYAVIRLTSPFTLNEKVQKIQLISEEPTSSGNFVNSGWGDTSGSGSEGASQLQEVTLPLVSRSDCAKDYASINTVTQNMICAGSGGIGSCKGDSGGPLVYNGQLAGIVSWGMVPCAQSQYPGVYSNVAAARDFLDEQ